ncbi:hypothetical protein BLJAPNOD_06401 [Ensifer sp. M14]|nr:hypothetical protein BLJAPNOD_06401 [Ensifer sp. M14]
MSIDTRTVEDDRVQKCIDQTNFFKGCRIVAELQHFDVLGEHRVTEAIDDLGKFLVDHRVDLDRMREHERIDLRGDCADELFEDQVLIDHFGGEAGRLEEALTVPDQTGKVGRQACNIDQQPFVEQRQIAFGQKCRLDLVDLAVVLAVEDGVGRGQRDVLVAAAVADDEMRVQQLIIVSEVKAELVRDDGVAGHVVGIRQNSHWRGRRVAVVVDWCARHGIVGDVVEESPAGTQAGQGIERHGKIAFDRPCRRHHQWQTVGPAYELAIEVGDE